jgi:hypothetical protein
MGKHSEEEDEEEEKTSSAAAARVQVKDYKWARSSKTLSAVPRLASKSSTCRAPATARKYSRTVALQVAFERRTLKPVFPLDRL